MAGPSARGAAAAAEPSAEENARMEARSNELVAIIGPAVFLNVISGAMLWTARQAAVRPMFNSAIEMTVTLTRLGSLGALMEFLINPVVGKLSDVYGRRALIYWGNLSTMICRFLLFSNPGKLWPLLLEQILTIPLVTSFFTVYRAAISDELDGPNYAKTQAKLGAAAGLGVICGPLMSMAIMRKATAAHCFLASSVLSALSLTHLLRTFPETLRKEHRKPSLNLSEVQPLSFLQLLNASPTLKKMMMVIGLQTASEGRNVTDVLSIFLQNDLNWGFTAINSFVTVYGFALVLAGLNVKRMINTFGLRGFTTVSNTVNFISMMLYSIGTDWSMAAGGLFLAPGSRKRDAVESLIMKRGTAAGLGGGFISGAMMNWRSTVNVVGPSVFGTLYAAGSARKFPGLPFLFAAATNLAAQAVFSTLTDDDLGIATDDASSDTEMPSVFPVRPTEVTPDFLSAVLKAKVKGMRISPLGAGFVCDAHRCDIEYRDGAAAGPPTVVLKMPKDNAAARELCTPFFKLEAAWYQDIATYVPIASARAHGVFLDPKDPTRFLLVLEDLVSAGENDSFVSWNIGSPPQLIQSVVCDLARMHGQMIDSAVLDRVQRVPPPAEFNLSPGCYAPPYLGFALAAYRPCAAAVSCGFPQETPAMEMLGAMIEQDKDFLQWDYTDAKTGQTFRLPDGPCAFPHPTMLGEDGKAILVKACAVLGSRKVQTLLHGDGHPGNLFRSKSTNEFTWIDFQGYSVGPPGLDLAQALACGVDGCSRDVIDGIVREYYERLCEHSPPSLSRDYPFEHCWEDFLLGCLLWYPAYVLVHTLSLPTIRTDPEIDARLAGYRCTIPRYVALLGELGVMTELVDRLNNT